LKWYSWTIHLFGGSVPRGRGIQVWGPSGQTPEIETKAAIKDFLEFVNWDKVTRDFKVIPIPGGVIVHEFDYKDENQNFIRRTG